VPPGRPLGLGGGALAGAGMAHNRCGGCRGPPAPEPGTGGPRRRCLDTATAVRRVNSPSPWRGMSARAAQASLVAGSWRA